MYTKCLSTTPMRYAVLAVVLPLVLGKVRSSGSELDKLGGDLLRRDVDGHDRYPVMNSRREMMHAVEKRQNNTEVTPWNDAQANAVGVYKELGWDYDFCRIEWPRTAVVGNKLYIDGGMLWLSPKGKGLKQTREINTRLLEIDLSSPMTQDNYTVRVIPKPSSAPNVGAGQVFIPPSWSSSSDTFYTFGGYFPSFNRSLYTYVQPPRDPQGDIFSYDTVSDKWEKVSPKTYGDQVIWPQEGTSVSIPGLKLGFYLGGYQNSSTNSILKDDEFRAVSGFLRLEMDPNYPTVVMWRNESIPFDQTIGGSLVHIPDIGRQGILVKFGGYAFIPGHNVPATPNPMDQIFIYDIANATWYEQTATAANGGDLPTARGYTCNAMVPAKDYSSFNIYMYGGGGRAGGDGTDDMWVLSLPSFQWINIWTKRKFPTSGMSCNLINNNQILLVGPRIKRVGDNPDGEQEQCTALWSVYDITMSTFVTEFNPLSKEMAPVHRNISIVIGGGGSGSATLTKPIAGWKSPALESVFAIRKNHTLDTWGGFDNSPEIFMLNRAALIGGLAGGLVAILIFVACLMQRRRTNRVRGLSIFGRKRKSTDESFQELEAPRPLLPPSGTYYGQGAPKSSPGGPPQELPAPYPWAVREGMGDNSSRSEIEGGWEHQYEGVVAETPPPEEQRNKAQAQEEEERNRQQNPHAAWLLQEGGTDRDISSRAIATPPPETHKPPEQPENSIRPKVRRREVPSGDSGDGGYDGAHLKGKHIKRPSSRFSEDL